MEYNNDKMPIGEIINMFINKIDMFGNYNSNRITSITCNKYNTLDMVGNILTLLVKFKVSWSDKPISFIVNIPPIDINTVGGYDELLGLLEDKAYEIDYIINKK